MELSPGILSIMLNESLLDPGVALLASGVVRELDETDLRLLLALAHDPRATTVALAASLGLSRNTVQARLTALGRAGVFQGYDRAMAPTTAGFPLVAFTLLHVRQRLLAEITAALVDIPEVVQAHGVTGSADLLVRIVGRSAEDLFRIDAAMLAIPGVERSETMIGISEVIPYRLTPLLRARLAESDPSVRARP